MNRCLSKTVALALAPLALACATTGCKEDTRSQPDTERVIAAASEVRPPPAVASAIARLKQQLVQRLTAELERGGPVSAVQVCRVEAPTLTAGVQTERVRLGRTSFRLRNPANSPPSWAASYVKTSAGRKVADVEPRHLVDLGEGRLGYLEVLGMQPMCVTCHGARETMAPELRDRLAELYPQDQAVGFAAGDVRGWVWAEFRADDGGVAR